MEQVDFVDNVAMPNEIPIVTHLTQGGGINQILFEVPGGSSGT